MKLYLKMNQEKENLYNEIISKYNFNEGQKNQIKLGVNQGLNVSLYAKPEFTYWQMEQIRLGLVSGLDVETYLNPNINFQEMNKIRKNLEGNK